MESALRSSSASLSSLSLDALRADSEASATAQAEPAALGSAPGQKLIPSATVTGVNWIHGQTKLARAADR